MALLVLSPRLLSQEYDRQGVMHRLMPTTYVMMHDVIRRGKHLLPAGSLYFDKPHGDRCWWWDNCYGHLTLVLPNKHHWDIDSRARNCGRDDRLHRCWVRVGVPALQDYYPVSVSNGNDPCSTQGAGSIFCIADGWHGFLRDGWIIEDPIPYPIIFK
jgi:hypothetical protein